MCGVSFAGGRFRCYLRPGHEFCHTDGLGMVWLSETDVPEPRFRPGQRVVRPRDVYKRDSALMRGTVESVYGYQIPASEMRSKTWTYPEVYVVRWDHAPHELKDGYLPHGLDPE